MTPAPTLMRSILVGLTTLAILAFGAPMASAEQSATPSESPARAQIATITNPCPRNLDALHGSATYSYATDGALKTSIVNGTTSTLTYGPTGRLASVQAGTSTSKYVHDADGNILTRTDAAGNTTLYLPGQEITISPDKTGVTTDRYYSLGGVTVAMRINRANPTYLMTDLHNTAQVAFDPVSTTVIRRYLDPFGNPLGSVSGGTWPGDHGFLGKPVNATTGLTDVGAREYDPSTGRFTSVDPVLAAADPLQANGYTYADNNPMTNTDPTGLMREADPLGRWPRSLAQAVARTGAAFGGTPDTPAWHPPMLAPSVGRQATVGGGGQAPLAWNPWDALPWNGSPGAKAVNLSAWALGTATAWDHGGLHASNDLLQGAAMLHASKLLTRGSLVLGGAGTAMTFADDINHGLSYRDASIDAGSQAAGGYIGGTAGAVGVGAAIDFGATMIGAEAGAGAGSFVPVVGTLAGAAIGAVAGTVIGSSLGHQLIGWVNSW